MNPFVVLASANLIFIAKYFKSKVDKKVCQANVSIFQDKK